MHKVEARDVDVVCAREVILDFTNTKNSKE